jgi:hypothetical protein
MMPNPVYEKESQEKKNKGKFTTLKKGNVIKSTTDISLHEI